MRTRLLHEQQRLRLRTHVQATERERVLARTAAVRVLATLPREDDVRPSEAARRDATAATTEISTLEISEEF